MKFRGFKRIISLLLTVCILLVAFPITVPVMEAEAIGGVNALTCSGFISNSTARNYIDTMMRYYINSSSTLQSTLDNGNSVVFMFEGGSDNYWNGTTYSDNDYASRTQAVCIVVKKDSSGNAYIDYYCENSSSIPAEPSWCTNGVAYSGSTTLMDGTYGFYTWNHTGPYAAFQIDLTSSSGYCYYTPSENPNGYKAGASGINIHTRSTAYNGGSSIGWAWSEGCQVIGYGNDSSNEFNAFMKSVTGITWNPWISWNPKSLNTWASTGTYKGYFVVDRQLGMIGTNGTQYGSGSLSTLYNTTALTNITAKSTAARKAAGLSEITDYISQCTYYPAYGKLVCTGTDVWTRTLPCYASVNSSTVAISAYNQGDVLTCTGLFKNTAGEYWYRVQPASGSALYVRAAYMEFKEQYLTDITLKDHTKPNGHVKGTGFVVDGTISTTYNQLTAVSAYVHTGFGTTGEQSTGHRVTVSNNSYSLGGSTVDSNVWMNVVPQGPNTMVISAEYKNHYVVNDTTLNTNTGTVILAEDYFMVIPSSVSQSTCSHTYQTYTVGGGSVSCTETAKTIKACTTCGLTNAVTSTPGSHSFGDWVTTAATCTEKGSKVRTCNNCGTKETVEIPALGHSYKSVFVDATCIEYAKTIHTCERCGHTYNTIVAPEYSEWSEAIPEGIDPSLIDTKIQYRYSDYNTIQNNEPSTSGYTQIKKEWQSQGQKTQECVKSWDSGYDKSHSLYSTYNNTPITNSSNDYTKQELNSENIVGYIYYHWCSDMHHDGPYNRTTSKTKTDYYVGFHSFYSTKSPSESERTASDGSVIYSNLSCCGDSYWYYNIPVYKQTYTTYKALYTHEGWTDFSAWSDTVYTASNTRKVETRTLYRYALPGEMGDHNYVNGVCSVCGKTEASDYMYLFGFINGADYGYGDDSATIGIYKFIDGKLVATFTEDSYVGVKKGDNTAWYMAESYPGDDATSAVLKNADGISNPEKLRVPGGKEVTFTLTENSNGTYTLSFETSECKHSTHDLGGHCVACGEEVGHTFNMGACTVCGKPCSHVWENGVCIGCNFQCSHSFYGGECLVCGTPCEHNFEDGKCTNCLENCGHIFQNGICTICNTVCTHTFKNGECTICSKVCEHNFADGCCTICKLPCEHHFLNGECTICTATCIHSFEDGQCTVCSKVCENHNYINSSCSICGKDEPDFYLFGLINGKNYGCEEDADNKGIYKFTNGSLKALFTEDSYVAVKYADNSRFFVCDGSPDNGTKEVTLYNADAISESGKLFVPKGRLVTFCLTSNGDSTYTLSYEVAPCAHISHDTNGNCLTCGEACEHSFSDGYCYICSKACKHHFESGVCTICSYECEHSFKDGKCVICGTACEHNYEDGACKYCEIPCNHSFEFGTCTICKKTLEYYLAGYINGQNIGCEENFALTGYYLFSNGKLTVSFDSDSFVFVKTKNNEIWYMAETSENASSSILVDTAKGASEMMFIPGGVNVTFTLSLMENGSLGIEYTVNTCSHTNHHKDGLCKGCSASVEHSFKNGYCTVCDAKEIIEEVKLPEINAKYAYLSTENELFYKVVFSTSNFEAVNPQDMGLLVFKEKDGALDFSSAYKVSEGAEVKDGYFAVKTDTIHPKELGDTVYLRIYAKLSDGSFVYSDVISYSGTRYAYSVLRNPASTKAMKAHAVALLNFASEMQIYFDYNTDSLANALLTPEDKALASAYRADMVEKITKVDSAKTADFTKNTKGVSLYPTADFSSDLFTLSYNLKVKNSAPAEIKLYYWNSEAYLSLETLTKSNASGVLTMHLTSEGTYKADITSISAKDINSAIYVCVTYTADGAEYCTGVTAYSPAQYLNANANNSSSELNSLAQASVVYGYYAKKLFETV